MKEPPLIAKICPRAVLLALALASVITWLLLFETVRMFAVMVADG